MNYKTTLSLVILLALVGVFFYWARQQHPVTQTQTSKPVHQDGSLLFDASQVNAGEITRMELTYPNQTIKLERQNQNWVQTQPIHWAVNAQAITQLLQAVQSLRQVESFAVGQPEMPKPADIGLNPPTAKLTLYNQKKTVATIALGRLNLGNRAYLILDEKPTIYVVSAALHELLLNQSPTDWRVKTLDLPAFGETSKIKLQHRQHLSLLTQTQGRWLLQSGSTQHNPTNEQSIAPLPNELWDRTDLQAVSDLLSDATGILISRFVADNPADLSLYGLDTPTLSLEMTCSESLSATESATLTDTAQQETKEKNGITYALQIGSPTDLSLEKHFACLSRSDRPDKIIFEIGQPEIDKLARMPDDLRDRRLITINSGELRQITFIPTQKTPFALAWTPSGWTFTPPLISSLTAPAPPSSTTSPLTAHDFHETAPISATSSATSPPPPAGEVSFSPDPQMTANWINALFNARAIGFRTYDPTTFTTPVLTLHLTDITSGQPHSLRLFSEEASPATDPANTEREITETEKGVLFWIAVYDEEPVARVIPQSALPMAASAFDFYAAPRVKMP